MSRRYKTFVPINYRVESDFKTVSAPREPEKPKKKERAIRSHIPIVDWALRVADDQSEENLLDMKEVAENMCDPYRAFPAMWHNFCFDLLYPYRLGGQRKWKEPEPNPRERVVAPVEEE